MTADLRNGSPAGRPVAPGRVILLHGLGRTARSVRRIERAAARFLCWDRSLWHCTTMPVGKWVIRTALSVRLTCCPPAPEAR